MVNSTRVPQPKPQKTSVLASYIAADPKSLALLEQIKKIAATKATVLIRGESGVGKDLLAAVLHYLSPDAAEPLLKIDCASLPHELMESELFGYERGAFTGATQMKRGRLELAGAGTLVFDEIAALSPPMQAKLLRVIEERRFDRLGGGKAVILPSALRIVAITNLDLEQAVAQRSFREDLFYRLNVVPLTVPPLRERPADVRPLTAHLLSTLADQHGKKPPSIAPAALAALERYLFPGNVRELRNLLERCLISRGEASGGEKISLEDLPAPVRGTSTGKLTLQQLERAYIAEILDYTRGKKSQAAAILGISRKNLLEKRKRYGL